MAPVPSSIRKVGRITAAKSTWPQGCGMYQAAVMSGTEDFRIFAAPPGQAVPPYAPHIPRVGDHAAVSGPSAAIENAPGKPQRASGIV